MTGDDDRERVAMIGAADGPGRRRLADRPGDVAVARGLAERDPPQRRPDLSLKRRPPRREPQVEAGAPAREVLLELDDGLAEAAIVPDPVGPRRTRRVAVEMEPDEVVALADEGQAPHGALHGGEHDGLAHG
jgi:hypothetical protein